jgi:hypothetical protein
MNWLPWGKKKKFDFNAFLVSKAKQQRQEEDFQLQQKKLQTLETNNGVDADNKNGHAGTSSSMASMRKRASVRAHSLSSSLPFSLNQPKSFSLVLTDEDLKGLELQRKLEDLRRRGEDDKKIHHEEKEAMSKILKESKKTLTHKLRDGIDWSDYLEIAQQEIAALEADQRHKEHNEDEDEEDTGSAAGSMSSVQGRQEADLMKAMHKVELQERTRKRLQEFTNDEILRMYKMESTIKEDFAEREANILSQIAKVDANLGEQRQCHEARAEIYERMIARFEEAAELHVERVYKALREQYSTEEGGLSSDSEEKSNDGELKVRARPKLSASSRSYSSRILAVNALEKEESKKARESLLQSTGALEGMADVVEEDNDEEDNENTTGSYTSKTMEDDKSYSHSEALPGAPSESPGSSRSPSLRQSKRLLNSSTPSYVRSTGSSRNTRISASRATASAATRTSTIAASRSRAAGAAARAVPAVASRNVTQVGPRRAQSMNAAVSWPVRTHSTVQPRRVNSVTARK